MLHQSRNIDADDSCCGGISAGGWTSVAVSALVIVLSIIGGIVSGVIDNESLPPIQPIEINDKTKYIPTPTPMYRYSTTTEFGLGGGSQLENPFTNPYNSNFSAITSGNIAYITTDGGFIWDAYSMPNVKQFRFYNSTAMIAFSENEIYISYNGGNYFKKYNFSNKTIEAAIGGQEGELVYAITATENDNEFKVIEYEATNKFTQVQSENEAFNFTGNFIRFITINDEPRLITLQGTYDYNYTIKTTFDKEATLISFMNDGTPLFYANGYFCTTEDFIKLEEKNGNFTSVVGFTGNSATDFYYYNKEYAIYNISNVNSPMLKLPLNDDKSWFKPGAQTMNGIVVNNESTMITADTGIYTAYGKPLHSVINETNSTWSGKATTTWSNVGINTVRMEDIVIPLDPVQEIIGTQKGRHFLSSDGGSSWHRLFERDDDDESVIALALDPGHTTTMYMLMNHGGNLELKYQENSNINTVDDSNLPTAATQNASIYVLDQCVFVRLNESFYFSWQYGTESTQLLLNGTEAPTYVAMRNNSIIAGNENGAYKYNVYDRKWVPISNAFVDLPAEGEPEEESTESETSEEVESQEATSDGADAPAPRVSLEAEEAEAEVQTVTRILSAYVSANSSVYLLTEGGVIAVNESGVGTRITKNRYTAISVSDYYFVCATETELFMVNTTDGTATKIAEGFTAIKSIAQMPISEDDEEKKLEVLVAQESGLYLVKVDELKKEDLEKYPPNGKENIVSKYEFYQIDVFP